VKDHPSRWRYEIALSHIIDHFGRDVRLKALWIPELKAYQVRRQNEGAASNTINRELSTLSRLFVTMIEQQLVESNPVHLVRHLSTKSGQRQTYLSRETVQAIAGKCPEWFRFILWTAYYTGMRRGELLTLSRRQVNLNSRIITLTPGDTKEEHWKRIPIHRELIPVLEAVLQGPSLISGKVFGLYDSKGIRELGLGSFTNVWPRVCKALKLEHPWPRFHDLRHTWKTNARRSGMHPEIEKAIMGHVERGKSIHEGYGFVDNQELLQAIDLMSFDHGETVVMVAGKKRSVYRKKW
jgi:integrase